MKKSLFFALFAVFAVLFIGVVSLTGCNVVASSGGSEIGDGKATPPAGVTSIEVGSAGTGTATIGSATGTINVTVVDGAAKTPMTNLLKGNLKIFLSGPGITGSVEVTITSAVFNQNTGAPISFAMTLDRSGSMSSADLVAMEEAAKQFVSNMKASDQGAILNFGYYVKTDQLLTSDKAALTNAIENPSYVDSGGTALYDSIGQAALTLEAATTGNRKAVLAMTDGGENASSSTYKPLSTLIAFLQSKSVPVYTIGLGVATGSQAELDLKDIASGTGGLYYYAPTQAELDALYASITSALNTYYTVTFTLPSGTVFQAGTYTVNFYVVDYGTLSGSTTITVNL